MPTLADGETAVPSMKTGRVRASRILSATSAASSGHEISLRMTAKRDAPRASRS